MKFDEYHRQTGETAEYPGNGQGGWLALSYVGLGLVGETGEIANQLKKVVRDDYGRIMPARLMKLSDELGDVFWYLSRLCAELRLNPEVVMQRNYEKLRGRKANGTLHGDRREEGPLAAAYGEWEKKRVMPTEEDLADGWGRTDNSEGGDQ